MKNEYLKRIINTKDFIYTNHMKSNIEYKSNNKFKSIVNNMYIHSFLFLICLIFIVISQINGVFIYKRLYLN